MPLLAITRTLGLKPLSNSCSYLAISHLVNRFNSSDTATEFCALKTFFELALGLTRAEYEDGLCIPDTLNDAIIVAAEMVRELPIPHVLCRAILVRATRKPDMFLHA
jgi:hypothetical protein